MAKEQLFIQSKKIRITLKGIRINKAYYEQIITKWQHNEKS